MTDTKTTNLDSKTVQDFGIDGILSSMRKFMEEIPPMKTAKDIKFITNAGAYPYAFMVADGCRHGIHFMDEPAMRHFIKALSKRDDFSKHPVHTSALDRHFVGGMPLFVADGMTWGTVSASCAAGIYVVVDAWLKGKDWVDAWDAWIVD